MNLSAEERVLRLRNKFLAKVNDPYSQDLPKVMPKKVKISDRVGDYNSLPVFTLNSKGVHFEEFTENSPSTDASYHVCAVVPSYKRVSWLLKMLPNLYDMLLKPLELKVARGRLSFVFYVQDCNTLEVEELKGLEDSFRGLIKIIFKPLKKANDTITSLRLDYMSEALELDPSITHVMMTDDDIYVVDSISLQRDFLILLTKIIKDVDTVYDFMPYQYSNESVKTVDFEKSLINRDLPWLKRFQIYPRKSFLGLRDCDWLDISILRSLEVSEDMAFIILQYISGATYKVVYGFDALLHIGVEELLLHICHRYKKDSTHVNANKDILDSLRSSFDFGNSGYNIGGPYYCKVVNAAAKKKGTSLQDLFPAVYPTSNGFLNRDIFLKSYRDSIVQKKINLHVKKEGSGEDLMLRTEIKAISKFNTVGFKRFQIPKNGVYAIGTGDLDIEGAIYLGSDASSNDEIFRLIYTKIKGPLNLLIVKIASEYLEEKITEDLSYMNTDPFSEDISNKSFYSIYLEENGYVNAIKNILLIQEYCLSEGIPYLILWEDITNIHRISRQYSVLTEYISHLDTSLIKKDKYEILK